MRGQYVQYIVYWKLSPDTGQERDRQYANADLKTTDIRWEGIVINHAERSIVALSPMCRPSIPFGIFRFARWRRQRTKTRTQQKSPFKSSDEKLLTDTSRDKQVDASTAHPFPPPLAP